MWSHSTDFLETKIETELDYLGFNWWNVNAKVWFKETQSLCLDLGSNSYGLGTRVDVLFSCVCGHGSH